MARDTREYLVAALLVSKQGAGVIFNKLECKLHMKYLYRHTRAFRRVLGRSKKFKKGKSRAKKGGVVISEQYSAPIKNQRVLPNNYTLRYQPLYGCFSHFVHCSLQLPIHDYSVDLCLLYWRLYTMIFQYFYTDICQHLPTFKQKEPYQYSKALVFIVCVNLLITL